MYTVDASRSCSPIICSFHAGCDAAIERGQFILPEANQFAGVVNIRLFRGAATDTLPFFAKAAHLLSFFLAKSLPEYSESAATATHTRQRRRIQAKLPATHRLGLARFGKIVYELFRLRWESVSAHVAALTEGVVKAMFVAKLKTIVAVVMAVLILAAGAGVWHYAAVPGQAEESREEQSSPPKAALPKVEGRMFRIDLRLTREENGQRKALAYPRMIAPELKEVDCGMGPSYASNCGKRLFFLLDMGPSVRLKVGSYGKGKGRLDMTVSQPGKLDGDFDKDVAVESRSIRVLRWINLGQPVTVKLQTGDKNKSVLEVTAVIHEIDQGAVTDPETKLFPAEDPSQSFGESYGYWEPARGSAEWKEREAKIIAKMLVAAEKDLKIADYFRYTGHPDSARFYYELICRRYPGTKAAKRATQRLDGSKSSARVGQVFLVGNEKTSDRIILEQIPVVPGEPFYDDDIRVAERNLSRLKCFKSTKVEVLDREGDNVYRDIRITVEEK